MVSALDSGSSGPDSRPGRGHCAVLMGKTLKSLSTRGPGRRDTCHLTDFFQTFTDD